MGFVRLSSGRAPSMMSSSSCAMSLMEGKSRKPTTPRRLEPLDIKERGIKHGNKKLQSSLGLELKSLPRVRSGDQDYYLYPPALENERALKLERLDDGLHGSRRYVEKDENELFNLELRKTMHGVGFRVRDSADGKLRVKQVYTDNRAPFPKHAGPDDECLVLEGDIVLAIGDETVASASEVNALLFTVDHGNFVRIHLFREGLIKKREDARLLEEALRPKIDAKMIEAQQRNAQLVREQHAKLEKKLAMHKLAKDCTLLSEFISACDMNFTVPDVDLMEKLYEAFGQRRSIKEEAEDPVYRINFGSLPQLKPVQVYIMCQVLSKLQRSSLSWCKHMELDFAWRDLDRMMLSGIALLLKANQDNRGGEQSKQGYEVDKQSQDQAQAAEQPQTVDEMAPQQQQQDSIEGVSISAEPETRSQVMVKAEGINTGIDISIDKPCFYGNDFVLDVGSVFRSIDRLSHISLQKSNVDDGVADNLLSHVHTCEGLQSLDLSHNNFGKGLATRLATMLSAQSEEEEEQLKKVVSINLCWNELREAGGTALFGGLLALSGPIKLVKLDVSFNGLTDGVASSIRKLLESGVIQSLEELDVSNNLIQHAGGLELAQALVHPDCPLCEMSCGFNKLGFEATVSLLANARGSTKLETLRVENTCGDYSLGGHSGATVESEQDGEMRKYGDDVVQYLWDLKSHVSALRVEEGEPMIDVLIEYPFKLRSLTQPLHWFHKPLGISRVVEEEVIEEPDNHLKLTHSIFNVRTKEADSRTFYDTAQVAMQALATDWVFLRAKLMRFLKNTPEQVDKLLSLLDGTQLLRTEKEKAAEEELIKAKENVDANNGECGQNDSAGGASCAGDDDETPQAAFNTESPPPAVEVAPLEAISKGFYLVLYNTYRYCAALGNEEDCIGFNEFMGCCQESGITDKASCPLSAVQGAFVAANVEIEVETKAEKKAMDENPDSALCLYEFIEALMRLAVRKYFSKESKAKQATSAAEAFQWLVELHIIPNCEKMDGNVFRRDKMYWYDVVLVFEYYKPKLDKLWKEHASNTGANLLMDLAAFKTITEIVATTPCEPAQAFEDDVNKPKQRPITMLPPNTSALSFWAAKTMLRNTLTRNVRENARCPVDLITHLEFYEAIVRLADAFEEPQVYKYLGLDPEPLLSERLVCVLELMLGADAENIFQESKYPNLRARLHTEHVPMEAPQGKDFIFEYILPPQVRPVK